MIIISRAPLRLPLAGGGTDLPEVQPRIGAYCVAAAIDKWVTITLSKRFDRKIRVVTSGVELVDSPAEVTHPLVRECLLYIGGDWRGWEIHAMSDVPGGTGLGSSAAFCVALLRGLETAALVALNKGVAESAYEIEAKKLGEPIGRQDQYVSTYGGYGVFTHIDGGPPDWYRYNFEDIRPLAEHLSLFYSGEQRSAPDALRAQAAKHDSTLSAMRVIHTLAGRMVKTIAEEYLDVPRILQLHHEAKQTINPVSRTIAGYIECGLANGAKGAKLVGAGGGGFLLFYTPDKYQRAALSRVMWQIGLPELPFRFEPRGAYVTVEE